VMEDELHRGGSPTQAGSRVGRGMQTSSQRNRSDDWSKAGVGKKEQDTFVGELRGVQCGGFSRKMPRLGEKVRE